MSYNVLTTSEFKKDSKRLSKKYKSFTSEISTLISSLEKNPIQGSHLGNQCYKIRLAIKSKGKGKRGGVRIITCVKVSGNNVYLLSVYSKSEKDSISNAELTHLIKGLK